MRMYVRGATGQVTWIVPNQLRQRDDPSALYPLVPSGVRNDTVTFRLNSGAVTDTVRAVIAGVLDTVKLEIKFSKIADQPGAITVSPDNLICEGQTSIFQVPADLKDYGSSLKRYWEVYSKGSPEEEIQLYFNTEYDRNVITWKPTMAYSDDQINPVLGKIKVTPFTCEQNGESSKATPQIYQIEKFVRKKLFTDSFLLLDSEGGDGDKAIQALTFVAGDGKVDGYWQRTESIDACRFYSTGFNNNGNNLSTKSDQIYGVGDGYLYLQIGDKHGYEPGDAMPDSTRGEDLFSYVWEVIPSDALTLIARPSTTSYPYFYNGSNEFPGNYRACFRVDSSKDALDKTFRVNVTVTCKTCRERNGSTDPNEFVQRFTRVFTRIDSINNYESKKDYVSHTPFVSVCANSYGDFQVQVNNGNDYKDANITKFTFEPKGGLANLIKEGVKVDCPSSGWDQASECYRFATGNNTSTSAIDMAKSGDSVMVDLYPSNSCFRNGKDTARNGDRVIVYVQKAPKQPIIRDSILKIDYKAEIEPPGSATGPAMKQPFPLLMCNTSVSGVNMFLITNDPKDSINEHKLTLENSNEPGVYGTGIIYGMGDNPIITALGDRKSSLFTPYFNESNFNFRVGKKVAMMVYAVNDCGDGTPAMFYVNIIDTLTMGLTIIDSIDQITGDTAFKYGYPILNGNTGDIPDVLCEGVQIRLTNNISNVYNDSLMSLPSKDIIDQRHISTDRLELVWTAPSDWTFETTNIGRPVRVTAGASSGVVGLRLRNKCGMGSPISTNQIMVHPYTRTKIAIEDTNPCQGETVAVWVDTVAEAVGYEWRLPSDWKFTDNDTNFIYTKNEDAQWATSYMQHEVIVGSDSGYIYVVGKKDTSYNCNFDYDNYSFHL